MFFFQSHRVCMFHSVPAMETRRQLTDWSGCSDALLSPQGAGGGCGDICPILFSADISNT